MRPLGLQQTPTQDAPQSHSVAYAAAINHRRDKTPSAEMPQPKRMDLLTQIWASHHWDKFGKAKMTGDKNVAQYHVHLIP